MNVRSRIEIKFCDILSPLTYESNTIYIEKLKHLNYIEQKTNVNTQLAFGDVIRYKDNLGNLSNCKGLFYLLTLSDQNKVIQIKPDEHSLLPIYYVEQHESIYVSSSYIALVSILDKKTKNAEFYVEIAILYTQLNRGTYFNEIKKLNYGEYIELNGSCCRKTDHRFYDYFTLSPKSFKSSINDIALKFIDISKFYLNQPCAISLTGGFDGRTITGCAHYFKTDFINFSYGRRGNGDVENPLMIANKLGLSYRLIELEQDYIDTEYFQCVKEYINYSGGMNGFQYPQSIYYAKEIGIDSNTIVTGYLGSEILASAKNGDDEVCPQAVLDYLNNGSFKKNYAYRLKEIMTQLHLIEIESSITLVLERAEDYFLSLPGNLTKNQKLAVFSFENIYRNTFGIWIYNAMHYAKVRVPFIDSDFFNDISKTEVSQFYRAFLENSPLKRIYGQILYPQILKRVWPELNALNSSKGYPPKDILTLKGRSMMVFKRLFKDHGYPEMHGLDKMSSIGGAKSYLNGLSFSENHLLSNKNVIFDWMDDNSINRSLCFLALSQVEAKRLFSS